LTKRGKHHFPAFQKIILEIRENINRGSHLEACIVVICYESMNKCVDHWHSMNRMPIRVDGFD
jgi:hypothetical protein